LSQLWVFIEMQGQRVTAYDQGPFLLIAAAHPMFSLAITLKTSMGLAQP
jgi:hypothetical protein